MNKTLSNYTLMLRTTMIVKDANFSNKKRKYKKKMLAGLWENLLLFGTVQK